MFTVQKMQFTPTWPTWVDVAELPSQYWAKAWIAEHARNPRMYRIVYRARTPLVRA